MGTRERYKVHGRRGPCRRHRIASWDSCVTQVTSTDSTSPKNQPLGGCYQSKSNLATCSWVTRRTLPSTIRKPSTRDVDWSRRSWCAGVSFPSDYTWLKRLLLLLMIWSIISINGGSTVCSVVSVWQFYRYDHAMEFHEYASGIHVEWVQDTGVSGPWPTIIFGRFI